MSSNPNAEMHSSFLSWNCYAATSLYLYCWLLLWFARTRYRAKQNTEKKIQRVWNGVNGNHRAFITHHFHHCCSLFSVWVFFFSELIFLIRSFPMVGLFVNITYPRSYRDNGLFFRPCEVTTVNTTIFVFCFKPVNSWICILLQFYFCKMCCYLYEIKLDLKLFFVCLLG